MIARITKQESAKTRQWKKTLFARLSQSNDLTVEQVRAVVEEYINEQNDWNREQRKFAYLLKATLDAIVFFIMAFAIAAFSHSLTPQAQKAADPALRLATVVSHSVWIVGFLYLLAGGVIIATWYVTFNAWDEALATRSGPKSRCAAFFYAAACMVLILGSIWALVYPFAQSFDFWSPIRKLFSVS